MVKVIDCNNCISFIEKFCLQNVVEVEMLCKVFKVDWLDLVDIFMECFFKYVDFVGCLYEIFNDFEVKFFCSVMYQEGFIICQVDDIYYVINFKEYIFINLNEEGFDVEWVKKKFRK